MNPELAKVVKRMRVTGQAEQHSVLGRISSEGKRRLSIIEMYIS
jgi:hypothetical protein